MQRLPGTSFDCAGVWPGLTVLLPLTLLLVAGAAWAEPVARFPDVVAPGPTESPPPRIAGPSPTSPRVGPSLGQRPGATWALARARRLAARGDREEATEAYVRAIELAPTEPKPYLELAELYRSLGQNREAERVLSRALALLGPTLASARARVLFARAALWQSLGRAEESKRDLEAAVREDPSLIAATAELAQRCIQNRSWAAALTLLRRLLESERPRERPRTLLELKVKVRALLLLAAEADPVTAGGARGWVRGMIRRIDRERTASW